MEQILEKISEYALSGEAEETFNAFAAEHYSKFDFEAENLTE